MTQKKLSIEPPKAGGGEEDHKKCRAEAQRLRLVILTKLVSCQALAQDHGRDLPCLWKRFIVSLFSTNE